MQSHEISHVFWSSITEFVGSFRLIAGIAPAWGLSQKLARSLGPSRAKELHFSGAQGGHPEKS